MYIELTPEQRHLQGEMRQYFVMRLNGGRLCNVTLTLPQSSLTESNAKMFMNSIASLKAL